VKSIASEAALAQSYPDIIIFCRTIARVNLEVLSYLGHHKQFLYPPGERSELARYHVLLFSSFRPPVLPSVRTQYLDANMSKTV